MKNLINIKNLEFFKTWVNFLLTFPTFDYSQTFVLQYLQFI